MKITKEQVLKVGSGHFGMAPQPDGETQFLLMFDVPTGTDYGERVTLLLTRHGMEQFEQRLRAWRSGIELPEEVT